MDISFFAQDHKGNEDEFEPALPMSEARDLILVPMFHYSVFLLFLLTNNYIILFL